MPSDEQFQKENYPTTQRTTEVNGVRIASAHSRPPATSSSRVSEPNDRGGGRSDATIASTNLRDNTISKNSGATPLDRRPGALEPASRDTKPRIEVVERQALAFSSRQVSAAAEEAKRIRDAAAGFGGILGGFTAAAADAVARGVKVVFRDRFIVGAYDGFILTNVQEQDAEKVVVTETFGDPHIFASGRFIRKYTFTGFVRTSGVNYLSTDDSMRVPQNVQFRVFYDKYLRVTEQVRAGRFTRISVDGEIYEGYVTTMNRGRDSMNEFFQSFTFTMLGVRQENSRHEGAAERLLRKFQNDKTNTAQYPARVAQAELTDALGELELYLTDPRALTVKRDILTTSVAQVGREDTRVRAGVRLGAIGNPQILRVEFGGAPGVDLAYTTNIPSDGSRGREDENQVHRTLATVNGEGEPGRELELVIKRYGELFRWAIENEEFSGDGPRVLPSGEFIPEGAVRASIPIKIIADGGASVDLSYELILLNRELFKLAEVTISPTSGGAVKSSQAAELRAVTLDNQVLYTENGSNGIVSTGGTNQVSLQYVLKLTDTVLNNLPPEAIQGAKVTTSYNILPVTGSRPVSSEITKLQTTIASSTVTPLPSTSEVRVDALIQLSPTNGVDLSVSENNPFSIADGIEFITEFQISIPGYQQKFKEELSPGPVSVRFIGKLKPAGNNQLESLQFLGYTKQQIVRGGSLAPDMELGYYRFKIGTQNGEQLSKEVIDQIKTYGRLSLTFQGLATTDVPLDGSAATAVPVGKGGNRIFLFFRASSRVHADVHGLSKVRESFTYEDGGYVIRIWIHMVGSNADSTRSVENRERAFSIIDPGSSASGKIFARISFRTPVGINPPPLTDVK